MHNAVADFHFLVLVHERLADIRVVSVLTGRVADECRPIGNRFLSDGLGKILSRGKDGRGGPDGADRRHINVFGGKSDERSGGSRICIDVSISGDGNAIERGGDFFRRVQPPTVGVHFNHDCARFS